MKQFINGALIIATILSVVPKAQAAACAGYDDHGQCHSFGVEIHAVDLNSLSESSLQKSRDEALVYVLTSKKYRPLSEINEVRLRNIGYDSALMFSEDKTQATLVGDYALNDYPALPQTLKFASFDKLEVIDGVNYKVQVAFNQHFTMLNLIPEQIKPADQQVSLSAIWFVGPPAEVMQVYFDDFVIIKDERVGSGYVLDRMSYNDLKKSIQTSCADGVRVQSCSVTGLDKILRLVQF
jgi:hypothetical protein